MGEPLAERSGAEPLTLRVPYEEIGCGGPFHQYYYRDQPFSGVAYTLHQTGQVESEIEFRNGHPNGVTRVYTKAGVLREENHCWSGIYHGRRRLWQEDGRPELDEQWELGICVARRRYVDGQMVEDYRLARTDPAFRTLEVYRQIYGPRPDDSEADPT
ncbi:MAG TPA: hypothetical protein VKE74_18020 [Gemmataceae bacterium]|nr:hypothetical protein [Gemmataceae bacterium]